MLGRYGSWVIALGVVVIAAGGAEGATGDAHKCPDGSDAVCCDIDASCTDGDDDWCCGDAFYCSTDGLEYAQSRGGILCPWGASETCPLSAEIDMCVCECATAAFLSGINAETACPALNECDLSGCPTDYAAGWKAWTAGGCTDNAGCNLCGDGVLYGSQIAGTGDDGNQYTCDNAQGYINGEQQDMTCEAAQAVWALACCVDMGALQCQICPDGTLYGSQIAGVDEEDGPYDCNAVQYYANSEEGQANLGCDLAQAMFSSCCVEGADAPSGEGEGFPDRPCISTCTAAPTNCDEFSEFLSEGCGSTCTATDVFVLGAQLAPTGILADETCRDQIIEGKIGQENLAWIHNEEVQTAWLTGAIGPTSFPACVSDCAAPPTNCAEVLAGNACFEPCFEPGREAEWQTALAVLIGNGAIDLACALEVNTEAPTEAPTDAPTDAPTEAPAPSPTAAPADDSNAPTAVARLLGAAFVLLFALEF